MKQKSQLLAAFSSLLILFACGGGRGSGTPIDLNTPADFVMEVPVDTTEYVNADDMTDMATFNPLSVKMAYADTILQMPPLTSNVIQSWCEGDGATLYDEADPAGISLLPLIGERKKLVVGEQYQLIVEADRLTQYNPCSHGRAVTGGWSFEITGVTVGEIEDNVIILDQFETGELVIEILDNGTDYSVAPVVTIALEGTDYSGPITGSAEFEIIKDPIQVPHANRLKFDGKEVKSGLIDNVVPLLQELRAATYWLSDEVLAVARKLSGE